MVFTHFCKILSRRLKINMTYEVAVKTASQVLATGGIIDPWPQILHTEMHHHFGTKTLLLPWQ